MAEVHPLMLYNTLTRRKERFVPLDAQNVRMYVCGPTVYDYAHIGNARPVIVFDVLFRLLRHLAKQGVWDGGKGATKVTYVRNITDVDDKINARAAQDYPDLPLNEAIRKVTTATEKQFHDDIKALGVLQPTHEPRATEHIAGMKQLIETLIANGNAYVAEGHVLFHVPSMPDYGKLSNRTLDEMAAGARVEVAPYKKDPMDFVLWKPSKAGEPSWPSPAGIAAPGRPGWHIECSAMAEKHLGQEFDIHGGGIDLVFPHHENEIAQSRCAHGTPVMARYWLHNGFLKVEGEKMSKSLGNFITIHELLHTTRLGGLRWNGSVIRYAMMMTHYRQPLDFTQSALEQAWIALSNFKSAAFRDPEVVPTGEFLAALQDDLNTPRAITELYRLFHASRDSVSSLQEKATRPGVALLGDEDLLAARQLFACLHFIGIDLERYDPDWAKRQADSERIEIMIAARLTARKSKNFKEADRIRDELAATGVVLKDAKDPATGEIVTTWELAR